MTAVNRDPLYLQVAHVIVGRIESGELVEGGPAPTTREIVEEFGLAMGTAAKTHKWLQDNNYTRVKTGRTVVDTSKRYRSAADRVVSMVKTGKIYPPGNWAKIVSAELVESAPENITEALGTEPGSSAVRRERITYSAENAPLSASVSWYDGSLADLAPQLLVSERIEEGTPAYLAAQTGRRLSRRTKAYHWADTAAQSEAEQLQLPNDSPVLRGVNWMFATDGTILEYGESVAGPGVQLATELDDPQKD